MVFYMFTPFYSYYYDSLVQEHMQTDDMRTVVDCSLPKDDKKKKKGMYTLFLVLRRHLFLKLVITIESRETVCGV